MKIPKIIAAAAAAALLASCGKPAEKNIPETSFDFTRSGQSVPPEFASGLTPEQEKYSLLNYDEPVGLWLPYVDYAEYMKGKDQEEFRSSLREKLDSAKAEGVNTVYFHARACGDAYYESAIFQKGEYYDGDYDPLEIAVEEAHASGLSIHAWINPLRCFTTEQAKNLPEGSVMKQWTETEYMSIVDDRYYLNPAYDEAIDFICIGAEEILEKYQVDGLHIDDYFYPTTALDFDEKAYNVQRCGDLAQWRMDNCSRMVRRLYETVKNVNEDLLFGISPQGNIDANYSTQYADVKLWCSQEGYCDYIIPQIYFGFENENCPFTETLKEWEEIVTADNISLIIGLAAYKQGEEDKWAGEAGEKEWIENPDIIERQIAEVKASKAVGYALYC